MKKKNKISIDIEKNINGSITLKTYDFNTFYKMTYYQYELQECISLFKEYVNKEESKVFYN